MKYLKKIMIFFIKIILYVLDKEHRNNEVIINNYKKISKTYPISGKSDFGTINEIYKTVPYNVWELKTETFTLYGADKHIVIDENFKQIHLWKLKPNDKILTSNGVEKVVSVRSLNIKTHMYCANITTSDNEDKYNHLYYTNNILSHNTTCAAAYILWYAMFHSDVCVLIVANVHSQALEIMERIRYSYQQLPDFLRAGAVNYNKLSLDFDNGSRIVTRATSADSTRGLTVNLLYADEFAFVKRTIQSEFWTAVQPTLSCVAGDTLVLTDTGYRRIEDFHQNKNIGDYFEIKKLNVWGKNGIEKVSHGYVSPESETLIIETELGNFVEITEKHPLYILDNKCHMMKAEELSLNDYIKIPFNMNQYGNYIVNDEDLTHYGYLLGHGGSVKNSIYDIQKQNVSNIIKDDDEIYIPYRFFFLTKTCQQIFLKSLFNVSSIVTKDGVEIRSKSRRLIHEVQLLMLNMGYIPYVLENDDEWSLLIKPFQMEKFHTEFGFDDSRKELLDKFKITENHTDFALIPFNKISNEINRILDKFSIKHYFSEYVSVSELMHIKDVILKSEIEMSNDDVEFFNEFDENTIWSKITKITPSENKTFDFTVPETHSFLQNGILGSNTGGKCIITSTPNNDDDQFAKIWFSAINTVDEEGNDIPDGIGRNGFKGVKVTWDNHPDRDDDWAKSQIQATDEYSFRREHNCEFITVDETLIDSIFLQNGFKEKKEILKLKNNVYIYEPFVANKKYVVALDPAMGTGYGDYSAIEIFSVPDMRQVGEWRSQNAQAPDQVNVLRNILITIYNTLANDPNQEQEPDIYWTIENNSCGEAIIQLINQIGEDNFPGWFITEPKSRRKGFCTTNRSKLMACSKIKYMIEKEKMIINSKHLINEFKHYVATGASFAAQKGTTDDLVSACLLIIRMLDVIGTYDEDIYDTLINDFSLEDEDEDYEGMPIIL